MLKYFDYSYRRKILKYTFSFLIDSGYTFYSEKTLNFMEQYCFRNDLAIIFTYNSRNDTVDLTIKSMIGNIIFETYGLLFCCSKNMILVEETINEIQNIQISIKNRKRGMKKYDFCRYIDCYEKFIRSNMNKI